MHLGICAQRLTSVRTGVARYLSNLLSEWSRMGLPFDRITLFAPQPVAAAPIYAQVTGGARWPRFAWEHAWIPLQARRHKVDLLFSPGYVLPLGWRGRGVVAIHDVMQEAIPEDFPRSSRLRHAPLYRSSARRATHVLTISEASSRDLQHYYRLAPDRISVIHLAADPQFSPAEETDPTLRERYGFGKAPLILFVGKFSRRRNLPALVEAFARLIHEQQLAHKLILVGVNHLQLPIMELAHRLGVGDRVIHTDFIQDADLVQLYRLAELFIYPSEMEGFGLPLVEAMASGTPVITLRRPVLVEVAAEAAYYANTGTPEDLHAAMVAVLTDSRLRDQLCRKGLERARMFSWTNTARQTMDILYSVVEERHHVYQQRG